MSTTGSNHEPTWAQVYVDHGRELRRHARSLTRGRTIDGKSADGLVQEVFIKVMTSDDAPQGKHTLPYLKRAVTNAYLDAYRRQKRIAEDKELDTASPSQETFRHGRFEEDVDADLVVADALAAVDNDDQQYAVVERIIKGRSPKDIAAELELGHQQRVSQLYRAGLKKISELPAFKNGPRRASHTEAAPSTRPKETS